MTAKTTLKLNSYLWQGFNSLNLLEQGVITSSSLPLAKAELRRQGIRLNKIKKQSKLAALIDSKQKITIKDLANVSRQLAALLAAGIPIAQALTILSKELNNSTLQKLLKNLKTEVEAGSSFSHSLAKYPQYFNQLFYNLVCIGEQSGTLEIMLYRIAHYQAKMLSLKAKIKKASFYPLTVLFISLLISFGMLVFIIPQFEALFNNFGADLPALTCLVIKIARFCQTYTWLILVLLGLSIAGFKSAKQRSIRFISLLDRLVLQLPVFGKLIKKAIIARFARTLSISFAAGLPLVDALQTVSGATANQVYITALVKVRHIVISGQPLQAALKTTQLFPNLLIKMVAIGEETGSLDTMLSKIADFYEEEVDNAIDKLSSLIEPMLMVILGSLIGSLVIAMYLPLFKLGGIV